ncbi:MAG: hypothetical protein JJT88_18735 [Gammaproteobacteria bacterium]|nr:hypothetical protein [Gammaproteobacteria bacterium]
MTTLKQFSFVALLIAALLPFSSHASVSGDIGNGVPADQVIANGLARGLDIDAVMDQIAQVVGSGQIGQFAGSAIRTLAAATDTPANDPALTASVNAALGSAAGKGYPATNVGQAYAANSASFQPVATAAIRAITGLMSLRAAAPSARMVAGLGAPRAAAARGPGSGGGGGRGVQDALCEAVGSEPGCLD